MIGRGYPHFRQIFMVFKQGDFLGLCIDVTFDTLVMLCNSLFQINKFNLIQILLENGVPK